MLHIMDIFNFQQEELKLVTKMLLVNQWLLL